MHHKTCFLDSFCIFVWVPLHIQTKHWLVCLTSASCTLTAVYSIENRAEKINQTKYLIEADLPSFNIHCCYATLKFWSWQLSDILLSRTETEKWICGKRGGSVNNCVYAASGRRVFFGREAIFSCPPPPDLNRHKAILKNEWKGDSMFTFTTDTFFSKYTLNYSYSHCQVGEELVVRVTVLLKTLLNCRKCVEKKSEREASLKRNCDCQCSEDSLCPHLPSSLVYRNKIKMPQGKARWPRQRHRCRTWGCWETEWFERIGCGLQKGLSLFDRMFHHNWLRSNCEKHAAKMFFWTSWFPVGTNKKKTENIKVRNLSIVTAQLYTDQTNLVIC